MFGVNDLNAGFTAHTDQFVDLVQHRATTRRGDRRVFDETVLHVDVEQRQLLEYDGEIDHGGAPGLGQRMFRCYPFCYTPSMLATCRLTRVNA